MNKLALCLFTSTKGHFGRKDIYKITIENLFSQIGFEFFHKRVAHIKRSDGDDETFEEMLKFFNDYGFIVIYSFGQWSHNNNSHASEYTKDIITMFSNKHVNECDFNLWLEDDWLFKISSGNSLFHFFDSACESLRKDKDLLCLRFNSQDYDKDKVLQKDGYLLQAYNYTQYGPTFTFQPNITRTRDSYIAYKVIRDNQDKIGNMHIELQSGLGYKHLSNSPTPFGFFDFNDVKSIHIGSPPFENYE
jgi:hypothetical protein